MEGVCSINDSSFTATSPSSYSTASSSPSINNGTEGASSPTVSGDTLPPTTEDWEILSDFLNNDDMNFLSPCTITSGQKSKSQHTRQSEATPASPFSGALPTGHSTLTSESEAVHETRDPNAQEVKKVAKGRRRGRKVVMKKETLSLEEQKKQRRRLQIATSVQRHREKKKCLVTSLQAEVNRLTAQLATMRAERRALLANNEEFFVYEEEAMTQRCKRKQVEETNQMLKQALFQHIAFLEGMEALMGVKLPCFQTLEFHDWVHSYTALASKDIVARRKEYVAHFPPSKMELAKKLVIKGTEKGFSQLLATGQMYSGTVKILHDGTRDAQELDDVYTDAVMRELFGQAESSSALWSQADDAGDGRVIKEFSSVFLFQETAQCTVDTLIELVFICMKSTGVYYPGASYQSRSVDEVDKDDDNGATKSRVYYSDLAASMQPIFEVMDESDTAENINVEARVLTREQRNQDEGMILWDYVDEDSLHPMPMDAPRVKTIRRNVCGGMVIRREPGSGMLSVRHVSVKGYCPLATGSVAETPDAVEARRVVTRRIGLQATEHDRTKDRCMRYLFNDITSRMSAHHVF